MENVQLEIRKEEDLTHILLNRPRLGNCLSNELVIALSEAVAACGQDGTRMLVIEGSGQNFCTGFDLSGLDAETDDTLLARFVRVELLLQAVCHAPFATVALARGRAFGAGADLFAACEQRWIVDSAAFSFPGAAFGLVLGTSRLARLVGARRAREWVRSGEVISAESALEAGLASRMIDAAEVGDALDLLRTGARRLDATTQASVHAATLDDGAASRATDLYRLALSAARPGIKERIEAYRLSTKKQK